MIDENVECTQKIMFTKHKWKLVGLQQDPRKFRCHYCNASYDKSGRLSEHHRMKHSDKEWKGPRKCTPIKHVVKIIESKPKPKIKKKRKKPKAYVTRQNQDKLNFARQLEQTARGEKSKLAADLGIPRRSLYRWKESSPLKDSWKSRKTSRARICMKPTDERLLGKFHPQQRKVYNLYRYRREKGDPCDHEWFKSTMRRICNKDKPEGYDPTAENFGNQWKVNFCKRWRISVQKKTNNKAKSVYERIHKVSNYHWYAIYKAATEPL